MANPPHSKVKHTHKKRFGHYLNADEEMFTFSTVSKYFLLNKLIMHFLVSGIVIVPIGMIASFFLPINPLYAVGIALFIALLYALQRYYFTKEGIQYILTNKRLIVQKGYFHINLYSANYNKITHVEIHQNFIDRVFYKHGKLVVYTAGIEAKPISLEHLSHPLEFKNLLEKFIALEKHHHGYSTI